MPKKKTEKPAVSPSPEPIFADRPGQRWTFLSNHAHVLAIIHSHTDDMSLREVAALVGITERAVQRIILELEEAGYLVRFRNGRRNQYKVRVDLPLRHPIEAHRNIGDLLALVQEVK